jgi:hypothetical protein
MNYLLFSYYDETIEDSENKTQQIATMISENLASGNVKFIYGSKHAIFHFDAKGPIEDIQDVLFFVNEEVGGFEYFLTKKPTTTVSNLDEDNLNDFLSLRNTTPKPTPPRLRTKNLGNNEPFFDIADLIMNFKRTEICDMTLDELLDKIGSKGMESLSELERKKLEEYSKSL